MSALPKGMKVRSAEAVVDAELQVRNRAQLIAAAVKERQAPARSLGLPFLLDDRRLAFAMPNGCFKAQAVYDRVYVWQIPDFAGDKVSEDSKIILTENTQDALLKACPRGIIVSAGLDALDTLRSNGMDLGHIIHFINMAPYRRAVEVIAGHAFSLIILRVGEILDSEDLRTDLSSKVLEERFDREQAKHHYFNTNTGQNTKPRMPWQSDDT